MLGGLCGQSGGQVADYCIYGAHVSSEFIWRRVLSHASCLPWSLARGYIASNLRELASEDKPTEPVSGQLWELMQQRFNIAQLVATVELFAEVSWTSMPAEQQHASLAQLHKWHPEYSPTMLVSRALMLQLTKLLPGQSKEDQQRSSFAGSLMQSCDHVLSGSMADICSSHP